MNPPPQSKWWYLETNMNSLISQHSLHNFQISSWTKKAELNRSGVDKIITKFKESFNKLEQGDKIILQCSYEKKIGMLVDCKLNVSQQCKK